ncbi:MAG: NUDIX hydrolase [archaeon]|jgi:ADP-ribose pyrophosphatase
MDRVKVSEYKTVFTGKTFTIKQAKATYPDGRIKTFEKASRLPSVAILALDQKNRLLLTREYRGHLKKYSLGLPAGRVEKDEKPVQAAKRELMEEIGYYPKKIKLFYKTKPAQSYEYIHYVFLATKLISKKLEANEYEDITTIPTTLSKAYNMVKKEEIKGKEIAYSICKLYWNRKKTLKS